MIEFSGATIFLVSAFLILVNVALYFSLGYDYGKRAKEKEIISLIVSKLDLQEPERLIKAVEAAAEKKQLLEAERDSLIKVINEEAEKQKNG